jgi:hypothetical protein
MFHIGSARCLIQSKILNHPEFANSICEFADNFEGRDLLLIRQMVLRCAAAGGFRPSVK